MGVLERADTSSNDFQTNTRSVGFPSQAASIAQMKVPKHTVMVRLQNAHTRLGGRGKISGIGGFC